MLGNTVGGIVRPYALPPALFIEFCVVLGVQEKL